MWNRKCFVIPAITGANGIVTKGLKISGNNTRKVFNRFPQRTAVLLGANIIRKMLQYVT
jgi:hypothetical protein